MNHQTGTRIEVMQGSVIIKAAGISPRSFLSYFRSSLSHFRPNTRQLQPTSFTLPRLVSHCKCYTHQLGQRICEKRVLITMAFMRFDRKVTGTTSQAARRPGSISTLGLQTTKPSPGGHSWIGPMIGAWMSAQIPAFL